MIAADLIIFDTLGMNTTPQVSSLIMSRRTFSFLRVSVKFSQVPLAVLVQRMKKTLYITIITYMLKHLPAMSFELLRSVKHSE